MLYLMDRRSPGSLETPLVKVIGSIIAVSDTYFLQTRLWEAAFYLLL